MSNYTFWQNLKAWLKEEKTIFDIVDRLQALLLLVVVMWAIKMLLDVFLD